MQSIQDDYNTQRSPLSIAEYGRTIQEYVAHIQTLPSKEERTKWVYQLVNIMGTLNPQIKLQADTICEKYVAQNGLYNYFNKIDEENNTNEIIDNQIGVLDTYVEPIKGMGIIVNNITILRTGAISAGGFINS